jgi:hypothetical protein
MSTNANYHEIFAEFVEGVKESEAKAPKGLAENLKRPFVGGLGILGPDDK